MYTCRAAGNFLTVFMKEFQCMVCDAYMHPPIKQCILGHSYCEECCKKLKFCPLCRSEHSTSRNHIMEFLHEFLRFPCRFAEKGCKEYRLGKEILVHENNCFIGWKRCPFTIFGYCTWTGPLNYDSILQHCQETHPDNTCSRTEDNTWSKIIKIRDEEQDDFLVFAFGDIIHCDIMYDIDSRMIMVDIEPLIKPENRGKYKLEVSLKELFSTEQIQYAVTTENKIVIDSLICKIKLKVV